MAHSSRPSIVGEPLSPCPDRPGKFCTLNCAVGCCHPDRPLAGTRDWAAEDPHGVALAEAEANGPPVNLAPTCPKIERWVTAPGLGCTIPANVTRWNGVELAISFEPECVTIIATVDCDTTNARSTFSSIARRRARGWSARQWREALRDAAMVALDGR